MLHYFMKVNANLLFKDNSLKMYTYSAIFESCKKYPYSAIYIYYGTLYKIKKKIFYMFCKLVQIIIQINYIYSGHLNYIKKFNNAILSFISN